MEAEDIVDVGDYRNSGKSIELRPKRRGRFIPPIPEWWAIIAMALPGKVFHVGAIIWQECRINGHPSCKLTRHVWGKFGLHRHTVRGGLEVLKEAGLIILQKSGKRSPLITIVNDESKVARVRAGLKKRI